jgi:hypothetical protein
VVRVFDAMAIDLHQATSVTAATSGSANTFPLTLVVPQRYTNYENTGALAGEPSRTASRLSPLVSNVTGKLTASGTITIRYDAVANGTTAKDIQRTVTWTSSSGQRSASRVISTLPKDTTYLFRSGTSTSASPAPIKATDVSIVAQISAPFSTTSRGTTTPTVMEAPFFLRGKTLR